MDKSYWVNELTEVMSFHCVQFDHKELLYHFSEDLPDGVEYQVVGDIAKIKEQEKEKQSESNGSNANGGANGSIVIGNINYTYCR